MWFKKRNFSLTIQLNPDYAIGIVARGEIPIKQTLSRLRHSLSYGEGEKVAKLAVLKGFHLVVDFYCIIWVKLISLHYHYYSTNK
jgi:hypothetical protein